MARRLGEAITILSLLLIAGSILFGSIYLGVQTTGSLPAWAGDIFTAFSGGILALLGTMFASQLSRQVERRRLEHEQAIRFVQPYRDFMIELYNLLSRKVYANNTPNLFLSARINVQDQEVEMVLKKLPPLASNYLVQKQKFKEDVEDLVKEGVILLQSQVDNTFMKIFDSWSKQARQVIQQLDEYENQVYR